MPAYRVYWVVSKLIEAGRITLQAQNVELSVVGLGKNFNVVNIYKLTKIVVTEFPAASIMILEKNTGSAKL